MTKKIPSIIWNTERLDHATVPWYATKTILEHEQRYKFARKFVKNKIVIDLGCGTGYGSMLLVKARAKKVYAVDIDSKAIEYARKNYDLKNINYIVSDIQKVNLKSKTADIIVSFEVIEHLRNPTRFLSEAERLLKSNGTLILSSPNANMSFGDNPYHIHEFTLGQLKSMLSRFDNIKFFGQRVVFLPLLIVYKKLSLKIKNPILRMLLRFRPWESYTIHPIKNSHSSYLYFICVCQKK